MAGPLENVRVVDLTTVVMGPYAARILGDLGAEVLKVEKPFDQRTRLGGDSTRRLGATRNPGMGSYFINLNRNKKSIALDLKRPEGLAVARKLLDSADVLLSNVRPRAMRRLGLSYEKVSSSNPRLIYVSLVGFGQNGPYAARPAYDDLMQSATGIAALAAEGAGDGTPRYAPFNAADRTVALFAVNAVLAALYSRERTGKGQAVEVPMFESMTDFVLVEHLGGLSFEPPIGPHGYARTLSKRRRPYKTLDGYISTVLYSEKNWKDFFAISGLQEKYAQDSRFKDLATRTAHTTEIYAILDDILATRTTDEWLKLMQEVDIPVTRVNTVPSLLENQHHVATGFFEIRDHPTEGRIRSMRIPGTWSRTQPDVRLEAPRLGEHSSQVLAELGYTRAEIEKLIAKKVVLDSGPSFA